MDTTFSRRQFLQKGTQVALAAGVGGSLLAACGGSSSSSNGSATIKFWHTYNTTTSESKTLVNQVIPAFHKKYPNITVVPQQIPDASMLQKLVASVAGGNGPDVFRSDIVWIPEFAKINALLPVDDVISSRKDEFYPGPLATCQYKGSYYAAPLDTNTRVIFYDKDLFSKAGLSQPPTTTDEFKTMAAKISALGHNIFGYAEGGVASWNLLPWIWCFGGAVTDENYTKATGYINGANSVSALNYIVDLYKTHALSPSLLGTSGQATSDAIGKNQAGMIIDGPWMPPIFQATYPNLKYDYALMPAGPNGGTTSVVGGEDIAIMRATKNPDAARKFVQFMTSEEAQVLMGTTGQMPVLKSLADNAQLPGYYKTFNKQLETAKPRPVHPNYTKMDTVLTDAFNRAIRGQATAQTALDNAATQIDALLQ
jgi:ABC-type sugar transport system, periplasmic component